QQRLALVIEDKDGNFDGELGNGGGRVRGGGQGGGQGLRREGRAEGEGEESSRQRENHVSSLAAVRRYCLMPEVAKAARPHAALKYPDLRYFLSARLTSVLSSEMVAVAVAWQVYEMTHRAMSLGYVGLAQFLPSFLLFLVAGHAVDRYDRRNLLLLVQASYGICAVLLLWTTRSGATSVAPIYAILVLQGTIRAFGAPAGQAFMPELVPDAHFANAVTWGSSVFMMATIVGPGLGGVIYGWLGGAAGVYAAAIVLYLASFGFTACVATRTGRKEPRGASVETLLEGIRYVRDNAIILGSISLDLFAVLLGGAVALLPIFASDVLHVGVRGLGALRAAP